MQGKKKDTNRNNPKPPGERNRPTVSIHSRQDSRSRRTRHQIIGPSWRADGIRSHLVAPSTLKSSSTNSASPPKPPCLHAIDIVESLKYLAGKILIQHEPKTIAHADRITKDRIRRGDEIRTNIDNIIWLNEKVRFGPIENIT